MITDIITNKTIADLAKYLSGSSDKNGLQRGMGLAAAIINLVDYCHISNAGEMKVKLTEVTYGDENFGNYILKVQNKDDKLLASILKKISHRNTNKNFAKFDDITINEIPVNDENISDLVLRAIKILNEVGEKKGNGIASTAINLAVYCGELKKKSMKFILNDISNDFEKIGNYIIEVKKI